MFDHIKKFIFSDSKVKFLTIIALLLFIANLIVALSKTVFDILNSDSLDSLSLLNAANDLTQIIFFVVIGLITVLSYLQAKKSLFTPIKTETFKLQIEVFEEILNFFSNKSDYDFTKQFDYDFMVHANSTLLFSDYLKTFFKGKYKVNDDEIEKLQENFSASLISKEVMESHFAQISYYDDIEIPDSDRDEISIEDWKKEKYGIIHISKKYDQELEKLRGILSSPLLPDELKNKLIDFENVVESNLSKIGIVLNNIRKEIPDKFNSVDSIKNFSQSGIWNEYQDEMDDFEPHSKEILKFIRGYLKIDHLIES